MHIPKFRTIIGQKLSNLRNRISPQPVWVKEELSQKSPVVGLKEDVFELGENQEVIHGVIIEKAPFKKPVYSLVPSKQVPYKETFTQSVKEKNPHITNLTNELERVCYNGMEFETLFNEQPHLSRTVGSLPQKWARKIGESKEKRDRVDELFSEFGKEFHSKVKSVDSDVEVSTDNLKEGLSDVLSTDVEIAPLGKGSWGQTYKINVDSQDYVLKVYYNLCPRGYGMREHYHGNFHELSSAVWASKNDADSYAMFYMGKFGEKQDGYMLTKYVPPKEVNGKKYNDMVDLDKKNFVFSNYLHKLHCVDLNAESSNRHGKKIVDFGDTSVSKAGKLDEKNL